MSTKPQTPEAPKSSNPLESDEHAVFVLTPSNSRDHHAAHKFLDGWTKKMTDTPPIESEYRFYELPANASIFMCFPVQKNEMVLAGPVKMSDVYTTEGRKNFRKLDESKLLKLCLEAIQTASKKSQAPKVYRPQITGVDPKRETSGLLKITDV
jgi:hypothetical protein